MLIGIALCRPRSGAIGRRRVEDDVVRSCAKGLGLRRRPKAERRIIERAEPRVDGMVRRDTDDPGDESVVGRRGRHVVEARIDEVQSRGHCDDEATDDGEENSQVRFPCVVWEEGGLVDLVTGAHRVSAERAAQGRAAGAPARLIPSERRAPRPWCHRPGSAFCPRLFPLDLRLAVPRRPRACPPPL